MKKMAVYILFVAIASVFAEGSSCRITAVRWEGDREAYDESLMQGAVGDPCESWTLLRDRLVRRYEDRGFPGAKLHGALDASGVLTLRLERGSAWVWAPPENLDSSGTKPEVFRRLSGIEEGSAVSVSDLDRSERKLARLGYFEKTAPTKLFRDPARNRLIPAYSMRKANMSRAEGLLTYSSEDDVWEGQVDVSLYNIAGTARDLLLEGFTGPLPPYHGQLQGTVDIRDALERGGPRQL